MVTQRLYKSTSRAADLTAKRPIDAKAYCPEVRRALAASLAAMRTAASATSASANSPNSTTLRVFDLGAGTLSMLPVVAAAAAEGGYTAVDYNAFDADR